jgi:hypothetical protein
MCYIAGCSASRLHSAVITSDIERMQNSGLKGAHFLKVTINDNRLFSAGRLSAAGMKRVLCTVGALCCHNPKHNITVLL